MKDSLIPTEFLLAAILGTLLSIAWDVYRIGQVVAP